MDMMALADAYKVAEVSGRYVTLKDIEPFLEPTKGTLRTIGQSVEGRPLYVVEFGNGPQKMLFWSQMHGNESTATKAVLDLFRYLSQDASAAALLESFRFCFVPMLNPDGAERYTRVNAAGVDLNRDFLDLSQPESRALSDLFDDFRPDFCFNLHDQRSIFGVGETGEPATLSFLAPAFDAERSVNETRASAMRLIAGMNQEMQRHIPGKVGRFDDGFNAACVGDNFQRRGCPTVLVESGHYPGDYEREFCRKLTFVSILKAIVEVYENVVVDRSIEEYLIIPENKDVFFDFGFKNVKINCDGTELITNFVAHYKEELIKNKLVFNAYFADSSNRGLYFAHSVYDAAGAEFQGEAGNSPVTGEKADFRLGDRVFVNAKPVAG